MVNILVYVAREDEYIEKCKKSSYHSLLLPKAKHAETKSYLDYSRSKNHKVGKARTELKPCGNLCHELLTSYSEVAKACIGHEETKKQAKT
jgi:hypothetical protein